jgi:GMP synthase (glutamine-hydrolysing)
MVVVMAPPNKIVVVITGDPVKAVQSRRGDYADMIRETTGAAWSGPAWRGEWISIDARRDDLEARLLADSAGSAVIITGSSANVHHREPWMLHTEAVLRQLVERGVPTLGVCFGHQLLAQALGGDVQTNPLGREMSTVDIECVDDDPLFAGLGNIFRANACHSDTVARPPAGAVVLAQSSVDPHQCLRFGQRCYGVQFHPEFDRGAMRAMIDARRPQLQSEGLDDGALMAGASDTPDAAKVFENFLAIAST